MKRKFCHFLASPVTDSAKRHILVEASVGMASSKVVLHDTLVVKYQIERLSENMEGEREKQIVCVCVCE